MSVNLTKRVVTDIGPRFVPVTFNANRKLKPDPRPGAYYLDWYEEKTRRRLNVGSDPQEAINSKLRKEAELNAAAHGLILLPKISLKQEQEPEPVGPTIQAALDDFIDETRGTKSGSTIYSYSTGLMHFQESLVYRKSTKTHLQQLDRKDLLGYRTYLRDKGYASSTIKNKMITVAIWLKNQKIPKILESNDWPQVMRKEVEIYDPEPLSLLLSRCTPLERMYWKFFLNTGEREQEVMHTCRTNLELSSAQPTVSVTHKPKWKWEPKKYKERTIPISMSFAVELQQFVGDASPGSLLFPTTGNKPKGDFLHHLKSCVRRAGMNCLECDACTQRGECEHWWLHKFRATFACTHLEPTATRPGVTLPTMMLWLGHEDLKATQRYVRASRDIATRAKVDEAFEAFG